MTLGTRIKAARERLQPKLTQKDVGAHFGVTDQAVSQWERDAERPDIDKIVDLADLLKVPCRWLLKGKGEPPAPGALETMVDGLTTSEANVIAATIEALRRGRTG